MPLLQRRAWSSLIIGTFGADTYWEDDNLRLVVVGIFLVGLAAYVAVLLVPLLSGVGGPDLDERDRAVLGRAGTMQTGALFITMAIWVVTLGESFHDQGAVPMVYLYLIFGSLVIVSIIGQAAGILFGYWIGAGHAES